MASLGASTARYLQSGSGVRAPAHRARAGLGRPTCCRPRTAALPHATAARARCGRASLAARAAASPAASHSYDDAARRGEDGSADSPPGADAAAGAGAGAGAPALHELIERLDGLGAKYQQLDDRLDALERALVAVYKRAHAGTAGGATPAPRKKAAAGGGGDTASGSGGGAAGGADGVEGTVEGDGIEGGETVGIGGVIFDISKLQSSVVETLNSGHLESIKTLRETLMAHEWELHGKRLAMRRGVANFEHYLGGQDYHVPFDVMSRLYKDPTALHVVEDERLRHMARAMIEQAVDDRYLELYQQCTTMARELANTNLTSKLPIPVPGAGAVSGVAGVVKGLLSKR